MLCTCTRQEASGQTPEGLERVKAGFQINRSLQQTHNIYEEMNVSGRMIGSSQSRLGVTQQPLLNEEHMVLMVSPLHALLRTFDFVLKLLVLLRANIDVWTENKKQLGERFESFKRAKNEVIAHVKEKTNITIEVPDSTGKGGTSTTGNAVHALMASDTNRKMLSSLVKDNSDDMEELLLRLWVICKIYNGDDQVTHSFKHFCTETSLFILTKFNRDKGPWIFLSPTVHGLLHHAPELIESNNGFGLQEFSESGLEANNKFLRFYRTFLARKNGQVQNLTDVFNRLWLKSDPCIKAASIKNDSRANIEKKYEGPMTKEEYYIDLLT